MKKRYILLLIILILLIYIFFPRKKYSDNDFSIVTYKSNVDKDLDGLDDQTDILNNALEYISKKPKYKSKYYNTGYSNDEFGVCTDLVAYALLNSGYDLMKLVNEDVKNNKELYNINIIDKNIDFRRVRNLKVYFDLHAISLSKNINDIYEWQAGDIVIFKNHIGIISNKRNSRGIPYVIHHYSRFQVTYEQDILSFRSDIIGHYRMS
ncbi:MAG: DUF1287 domain-containing protein [Bacilli bacterium]|nr:DUF1287 domain-containing protein [Bacilli bacterium]